MSRNIALTGMMGAGKSTVGAVLARQLGRGYVDTDEEVVRVAGAPIPVVFAERGEVGFRQLEHETVRRVASVTDLVISLGGGVVLADANVADLLLTSVIVYLEAPADVLAARLRTEQADRPLLAGDLDAAVTRTLRARDQRYREVSDLVVDATQPPGDVAREILDAALAMRDVLTPSEHEQVMR